MGPIAGRHAGPSSTTSSGSSGSSSSSPAEALDHRQRLLAAEARADGAARRRPAGSRRRRGARRIRATSRRSTAIASRGPTWPRGRLVHDGALVDLVEDAGRRPRRTRRDRRPDRRRHRRGRFGLVPPCADPGFDHRSCDYWEDADRGSKAARLGWLRAAASRAPPRPDLADNPFAPPSREPAFNPFARPAGACGPGFDPFARRRGRARRQPVRAAAAPSAAGRAPAPRKLALLGRGLAVFGSYAKVLLVDDEPAAYAQFGPLSAYPRAQRLRELYRSCRTRRCPR
jgi:hypothetical protein